jgi:hypothetical protein
MHRDQVNSSADNAPTNRQNVPMKLQVQQHNPSIYCSQTRMLNTIGDSEIEANKSSRLGALVNKWLAPMPDENHKQVCR